MGMMNQESNKKSLSQSEIDKIAARGLVQVYTDLPEEIEEAAIAHQKKREAGGVEWFQVELRATVAAGLAAQGLSAREITNESWVKLCGSVAKIIMNGNDPYDAVALGPLKEAWKVDKECFDRIVGDDIWGAEPILMKILIDYGIGNDSEKFALDIQTYLLARRIKDIVISAEKGIQNDVIVKLTAKLMNRSMNVQQLKERALIICDLIKGEFDSDADMQVEVQMIMKELKQVSIVKQAKDAVAVIIEKDKGVAVANGTDVNAKAEVQTIVKELKQALTVEPAKNAVAAITEITEKNKDVVGEAIGLSWIKLKGTDPDDRHKLRAAMLLEESEEADQAVQPEDLKSLI